jgi:hypothetical protein
MILEVLPLVLQLVQEDSVSLRSSLPLQDSSSAEQLRDGARELQSLVEKVQSTILENESDDYDSDNSSYENFDLVKWAF